jgi:hypothetical protein
MKNSIYTLLVAMVLMLGGKALMAQGEMSEEEMMKAWMMAITPNEEHAWLAEMVGEWTYEQTSWMDPSKEPEVAQGKSTKTMVLGGRYLRETFSSSMMGMPFQGEGTNGFNNLDQKYYFSWIDNMGTGIMSGSGERKGNVLTVMSTSPSMTGEGYDTTKSVTEVMSKDKHMLTMYMVDKDGNETKWMEIVFTRK